MDRSSYDAILESIVELRYPLSTELLEKLYPDIAQSTLGAILSQQWQRLTRRTFGRHNRPDSARKLLQRYEQCVAAGQKLGVLLALAMESQIPPALLAKSLLSNYLESVSPEFAAIASEAVKRRQLNTLMRSLPALSAAVADARLVAELRLCSAADCCYGPSADAVKRSVGVEYELRLARQLRSRGIAFFDENELRRRGYDKTPDFLLDVPLAVNGCVVNWIESKASFGDVDSHRGYMQEQFVKYWRRYGPGLVIYWFGYLAELIAESSEQHVLLSDRLPQQSVVFMDPELNLVDVCATTSSLTATGGPAASAPTDSSVNAGSSVVPIVGGVRRSLARDISKLSLQDGNKSDKCSADQTSAPLL